MTATMSCNHILLSMLVSCLPMTFSKLFVALVVVIAGVAATIRPIPTGWSLHCCADPNVLISIRFGLAPSYLDMLEFCIYVHNLRLHFGAVLQFYSITSILVSTYSSRVCTLQVLYSLTIHLVSLCQTRYLSTSPSCSRLFNRIS
jgi:hypothetical protein